VGGASEGTGAQDLADGPTPKPTWELAKARRHEADEEEVRVQKLVQSFSLEAQLGLAIARQELSSVDLMSRWFRDGEAKLNKAEWLKQLQALGLKPDSKSSDALFESYDDNRDSRLELKELQGILGRMQAAATAAAAEEERLAAVANMVRRRAEIVEEVLQAEERVREEEEAVAAERNNQPVMVQLGDALTKMKISVVAIQRKLDSDGDGEITKEEWHERIPKLVAVEASPEQLGSVFDELDADGGGAMNTEDLKAGIKRLMAVAVEAQADLARRKKGIAALRKTAAGKLAAYHAFEAGAWRERAVEEERERAKAAAEAAAAAAVAEKKTN